MSFLVVDKACDSYHNRIMARLFGVKLPQITRYELRSRLHSIEKNTKNVLYWQYSEFLLRANRNPWYKEVLNRASFLAIDGKGLHWAMFKTMKTDFLPWLYGSKISRFWVIFRLPLFIIMFVLQLVWNFLNGLFLMLSKFNFSQRTQNQVILGREFVYEMLKIAEEKKWKTLIIGGSNQGSEVTKNLLNHLFPDLQLELWTRPSNSPLMRDNMSKNSQLPLHQLALPGTVAQSEITSHQPHQKKQKSGVISNVLSSFFSFFWPEKPILTSENLFESFPDLLDAQQTVQTLQPDLVLVCIGGASGKQEFFIDALYQNPHISFTLATGLGAAMDHLGAGAKQKEAPKWMQAVGLEWLFRFITQPYRIRRILDSIVTLWLWTTVEEFSKSCSVLRQTVVNMIYRDDAVMGRQFLLVKRRNVLPGDTGYTFVQGEIEKQESVLDAGLREIEEEVSFNKKDFEVLSSGNPGSLEQYTTSFWRFLAFKAETNATQHYLNLLKYTGSEEPEVNWEHFSAQWSSEEEMMKLLSAEKKEDARIFLKILL